MTNYYEARESDDDFDRDISVDSDSATDVNRSDSDFDRGILPFKRL